MPSAGTKEGLLIQAIKNLGKDHIDPITHARIAEFLKDSTQKEIRENMKFASAWVRFIVFEIMGLKT